MTSFNISDISFLTCRLETTVDWKSWTGSTIKPYLTIKFNILGRINNFQPFYRRARFQNKKYNRIYILVTIICMCLIMLRALYSIIVEEIRLSRLIWTGLDLTCAGLESRHSSPRAPLLQWPYVIYGSLVCSLFKGLMVEAPLYLSHLCIYQNCGK